MEFDKNDIKLLALCAWREARGEGTSGMAAVMHVIVNRAKAWMKTIHEIIYAQNQFTSMSVVSDPEYHLMPAYGDEQFAQCLTLAESILNHQARDITNGALFYCNLATTDRSNWFYQNIIQNSTVHPMCAVIGNHHFYA